MNCQNLTQRPPLLGSAVLMLLLLLVSPSSHAVIAPSSPDAAELQLALSKLSVLGSVLYVGAHPDDENTALLAAMASGRLARTAYLSITRGDGGQNLIGTELAEELGVIRTQELLEARHRDGAEQLFTRAIDFGYTKSVDETLDFWGRNEVLGDVVRIVRRFQPDVIIMRFPGDGRGQHGQHTASAVLAAEAFQAAADPKMFPEQLTGTEGLQPWQAKRLMWDAARFFGGSESTAGIPIDLGSYSPLLGQSFTEIAAISRSMHKSQGFGSSGRRGSLVSRLEHREGEEADNDVFDGINTTWTRLPGGDAVGVLIRQATEQFDPAQPANIVPLLLDAEEALVAIAQQDNERTSTSASVWTRHKLAQLREVIRGAAGLWLEVTTQSPSATAGAQITLNATVINRSKIPMHLQSIRLPFAGVTEVDQALVENQNWTLEVETTVAKDQESTGPYWLQKPRDGALYNVPRPELIGLPEYLPLHARFDLRVGDRDLTYEVPILHRWSDRVEGELYRAFEVVPEVSVGIDDAVYVFSGGSSDAAKRDVTVTVRSTGEEVSGSVRLTLPEGWQGTPASATYQLAPGAETRVAFSVQPPEGSSSGTVSAQATINTGAGQDPRDVDSEVRIIQYQHIPVQTLLTPARARLVRMQLDRRGDHIGYVMGAGDEVPEALRQIGYQVTLLTDDDLASGDLSSYDAIAVGIRAYNARPAVNQHNARLLSYIEQGGTVVVQYNTASRRGDGPNGIGPYPFKVGRSRVSVEDAPVTLLTPEHPALTTPNHITASDFDGWVQERGLYFPSEWDDRYQPLIASHDPGEPDRTGGLLYANYGKGVYIYTGYSFFRELPAGVAGAYRLFVNLISARQ